MTRLYFAYGSNLDADQMRERCPESAPEVRAVLRDYRLDFTHYSTRWAGGAADIVARAGGAVWGAVYTLTEADFAGLDGFEAGYNRIDLEVVCGGILREVTTYAVRDKGSFEPSEIYLGKILHWGDYWGFPNRYLSELRRRGR